jgi:hypothetical protein
MEKIKQIGVFTKCGESPHSATIGELLKAVFSLGSIPKTIELFSLGSDPRLYNWGLQLSGRQGKISTVYRVTATLATE